jgi:hypothetical protein
MLLISGGCADPAAQLHLTEQARKGIGLVAAAQEGWKQSITKLEALRRDRLDEAFDADVREHGALSADWVIEHRKAYAIGLDMAAKEAEGLRAAWNVNASNLKAVDMALARLAALAEAQSKWLGAWEEQLNMKGGDDGKQ